MSEQKKENRSEAKSSKRKVTSRQIVAIAGIALLVLLYIITLIVAVVDRTESGRWFWICLFCTIALPLLIWIYTWLYGKMTGRHTFTETPDKKDDEEAEA